MTTSLRAAIYARFSTDMQRDASIEDQVDSCRDFIRQHGWTVSEIYSDEAISGSSMFRPGIERLQRDVRAGKFDIVVSEGLDRLSRSLADVSKFYDRMEHLGVEIWTITEHKVDKMVITLKGMMNEVAVRDIALKTLRGLKGRAKLGMSAGGNSYGYNVLPGVVVNGKMEHGLRAINPAQAEVVRRIFRDYAKGISPKKIAEALNIEGVPGPRGGGWSASTLHGNRERGTGILNNQLYHGLMVWNRLHYSKNPDTGNRVSRLNPADLLVHAEVPHLQIIEDDLWEKVRARQGALKSKDTNTPIWDRRRPRTLFSGMMKCGCCGSGFSKVSKDSFGCSAARNKGRAICTNMALIKQADLEARVLDALAHHLMEPEAVAAFCEAYTAERNRLAASTTNTRSDLERKLVKVKHDHEKLVQSIMDGVPGALVKDKMISLDEQRQKIEAKLASAQASPAPLRFHPKMAETYRDRVGTLIRGLGREKGLEETREALRGLIDKIVLEPRADGDGFDIDLHGALAGLLRLATGVEQRQGSDVRKKSTNANGPAGAGMEGVDIIEEIVLVAGTGFEPVTFRL
jgi:site-specific DNA recombinase